MKFFILYLLVAITVMVIPGFLVCYFFFDIPVGFSLILGGLFGAFALQLVDGLGSVILFLRNILKSKS